MQFRAIERMRIPNNYIDLSILFISYFLVIKRGDSKSEQVCPVWTHPNTSDSGSHYECVCGACIKEIVSCNDETLTVTVSTSFI